MAPGVKEYISQLVQLARQGRNNGVKGSGQLTTPEEASGSLGLF
jgi:hypothetical protein